MRELIIDSFAGGGGASTGIEMALGRSPDVAINHDAQAIAVHAANHPESRHFISNVWDVDPREATGGEPVGLMWLSPDCTFFSKARGGAPFRDRKKALRRRGLASLAIRWAASVKPRVIIMENVEEFESWCPLGADNKPDWSREGQSFRRWLGKLRARGYHVEWRQLRACDYGAPTSRKRLFLIARCDGAPIIWPRPTHGDKRLGLLPFKTAADCIDWSIPCPSIFERKKPLAEKTLARIARGLFKYVINNPSPFIVPVTHGGGEARAYPIDAPLKTITSAHRGEFALIAPTIARTAHGDVDKNGKRRGRGEHDAREPLPTQPCTGDFAVVAPTLIQTGWGERDGQAPRSLDLHKPVGTLMAEGNKHALVSALLTKNFGGESDQRNKGASAQMPLPTVTARDHHSVVMAHLSHQYTSNTAGGRGDPREPAKTITTGGHHAVVQASFIERDFSKSTGAGMNEPLPTVTAGGGGHAAEVRAFLLKYYSTDQDPQLGLPLHTITTKARFGLVTVQGVDYAIVDIGMRMLRPRELFRAQGFPAGYVIGEAGESLTMTQEVQVRLCGNSVCPPIAAALVGANCPELVATRRAA